MNWGVSLLASSAIGAFLRDEAVSLRGPVKESVISPLALVVVILMEAELLEKLRL